MFELLVADNLETQRHLWILVKAHDRNFRAFFCAETFDIQKFGGK
jgi:hypothetical protein